MRMYFVHWHLFYFLIQTVIIFNYVVSVYNMMLSAATYSSLISRIIYLQKLVSKLLLKYVPLPTVEFAYNFERII